MEMQLQNIKSQFYKSITNMNRMKKEIQILKVLFHILTMKET